MTMTQPEKNAFENLSGPGKQPRARQSCHASCGPRWHGWCAGNRCIVFQLLPHTLQLCPAVCRVMAKCHDIGNLGEYEGHLNIDERITADLLKACDWVASKVQTLPAP